MAPRCDAVAINGFCLGARLGRVGPHGHVLQDCGHEQVPHHAVLGCAGPMSPVLCPIVCAVQLQQAATRVARGPQTLPVWSPSWFISQARPWWCAAARVLSSCTGAMCATFLQCEACQWWTVSTWNTVKSCETLVPLFCELSRHCGDDIESGR